LAREEGKRDTYHEIRQFDEVKELAKGREPRGANGERDCESIVFLFCWNGGKLILLFFYYEK
jgi:hypothetical protein